MEGNDIFDVDVGDLDADSHRENCNEEEKFFGVYRMRSCLGEGEQGEYSLSE
jgi:hypothetical protein